MVVVHYEYSCTCLQEMYCASVALLSSSPGAKSSIKPRHLATEISGKQHSIYPALQNLGVFSVLHVTHENFFAFGPALKH